jgi:hypothetical protein
MLDEVTVCEDSIELSGSGLLFPSRNTGQGACGSGETKGIIPGVVEKSISTQP